ncbi:MAG: hypothetical protein IVW55_09010 [Chloroflexi bacterium]|nr:hypothetical protein [Chloroflexota bacterium]
MATSLRLRIAGVLVRAVTMMASLTACGGDSDAPAAKSNADLLKEAIANMKAAKTYHMEADLTSSGQRVTLKGDIDLTANNVKRGGPGYGPREDRQRHQWHLQVEQCRCSGDYHCSTHQHEAGYAGGYEAMIG